MDNSRIENGLKAGAPALGDPVKRYFRDAEMVSMELAWVLNEPETGPVRWRPEVRLIFQGPGQVKWTRRYQPGRHD